MKEASKEFKAMVAANKWHDVSELDRLITAIKTLSIPEDYTWSWSRNTKCKYVNIRIDMRDGGFTFGDKDGNRISLDQLLWQYGEQSGEVDKP